MWKLPRRKFKSLKKKKKRLENKVLTKLFPVTASQELSDLERL